MSTKIACKVLYICLIHEHKHYPNDLFPDNLKRKRHGGAGRGERINLSKDFEVSVATPLKNALTNKLASKHFFTF